MICDVTFTFDNKTIKTLRFKTLYSKSYIHHELIKAMDLYGEEGKKIKFILERKLLTKSEWDLILRCGQCQVTTYYDEFSFDIVTKFFPVGGTANVKMIEEYIQEQLDA